MTVTGSAPQYSDANGVWYECTGYRVDTSDASGWIARDVVSGSRTASKTVTDGGTYGLVWLWNTVGYRVSAEGYHPECDTVNQTVSDYVLTSTRPARTSP